MIPKQVKKFKPEYIVYGSYNLDEVLPFTNFPDTDTPVKRTYICMGLDLSIKMTSDRYRLFKSNSMCVTCGLIGTIMRLEHSAKGDIVDLHFNLYGIRNGRHVMLTKDHIIPKSKGGLDSLSNYQTMCKTCNELKGSKLPEKINNEHIGQDKERSV